MNELTFIKPILELGITGLLFLMWWFERKDRLANDRKIDSQSNLLDNYNRLANELIACIKQNTIVTVQLHDKIKEFTRD